MKRCVALLLSVVVCASFVRADNWPQWRGPNHDGISKETNIPSEWSDKKNVAWKLPLPGKGGSTPAIWGDHIFLTCADGKDLILICANTDGKELWRKKLGTGDRNGRGKEGNMASPSPMTDGKYVYALIGVGDFACFDFDGKEVWKFNVEERYGKLNYDFGMHSTPVLHGDRIYFQLIAPGVKPGIVAAIDKATGKEVWKVKRESKGKSECLNSYASVTLWQNGKDAYLIAQGNDHATAHKLDDGSEIWRVNELNPTTKYRGDLRFVASPVATPDLIVVPSAKNHAVVGVKPNAKGDLNPGSEGEAWRLPNGTPDVPSPLVHDGLVYLCGERGGLTCLDAKTGKQLYSKPTQGGDHRTSPVYADGKIYLTARSGLTTVVKAGPNFEVLATNTLPDEIEGSFAISGGRIYIHGWDALWAIGPASK